MRALTAGFVLAMLVIGTAAAEPPERPVAAPDVAAEIARHEHARVLVAFDTPGIGRDRSTAALRARAAAEIASARARILAGMPAGGFTLARSYAQVSAMAGWVNAAGLAHLASHGAVSRIDLDVGGTGSLNQARPLANVDTVHAAGFTGAGVTVAVLDSGYDSDHADLSDDLAGEACFCSGGGGCCPGGGSTETGAGSAEDDHGHGTNVTGIITSNGGVAPLGTAPDAAIVAVKVLDSNNSFCCSSDVVAGLDWIIANRPDVDVVNMSLGTFTSFPGDCDAATSWTMAYAAAIDTLRSNGVPVFVSAGNSGSGTDMQAPACIANSLSVGAVWDANIGSINALGCLETSTAADLVTCFSNSNDSTDLFAPGAPTASTGIGGGSSTFFGTSQASPLAAGCAALLLDKDPTLSPDAIETILEASPALVTDPTNGLSFPRVDCVHALGFVNPIPALPPWGPGGLALLLAATAGFALRAPTMNRHLRVLRRSGLIAEERVEEHMPACGSYRLRRERLDELQGWLAKVEEFWSDQLTAFWEHVERAERERRR